MDSEPQIITIRAAEAVGLKHYFTGKPCKFGHLAPRYVSTGRCVPCTVAYVIAWQNNNREKKIAKQRRYQARKDKGQKLLDSRRDHVTERQRKERRLTEIAGRPRPFVCDICEKPNSRRDEIIAFDHCHKHGHFRGWLCDRCNLALGQVEDDPELLRKMAQYLEQASLLRTG